MRLSIIIPVYRAEHTLDRCLESIVRQTFTDFEAILVDDGSPDACPARCDEWALKDSRIRVIHQPNGGLSAARNAGIAQAKGTLITFVDADDYLKPDTYEEAIPLAERYDIVEFPVLCHHGAPWKRLLTFEHDSYTDMKAYWLKTRAYEHCYAWNKIYQKSLFENIRFPVGKTFEDCCTYPLLLKQARHITTINQGLYYYCYSPNGITGTAQGSDLENLLHAHLETIKTWRDDRYSIFVLNIQMDVYELTGKKPVMPYRFINPFSTMLTPLQKLKAIIQDLLGIYAICLINKTLHTWIKNR